MEKEIENYLIKPLVLFRIIENTGEKYSNFIEKYEILVDTFKQYVIDCYTTKFQEQDRKISAGTAASRARDYINQQWTSLEEKLNIVSGKDLLRSTNRWIKENYKINCSMKSIFNAMKPEDIDREMV